MNNNEPQNNGETPLVLNDSAFKNSIERAGSDDNAFGVKITFIDPNLFPAPALPSPKAN